MTFFSPVVKIFTPMYAPPHPNLLWDLPESALANECLPDHQNNAMFIPEGPSSDGADHILQTDRSKVRLTEASNTKNEMFADQDIDGREPSVSTSSLEIQRKFREVDIWLEEQSRCHTLLVPTLSAHCREAYEYNDEGSIPHHLLVQMGLANGKTGAPRPEDTYYNGTYLQPRDFDELHALEEQNFESVDSNIKITREINGGPYVNLDYNKMPHENPSELAVTDQCEKSVSSLSQLFHDEELTEEDREEIARSINTINQNVGNKGHLLESAIGNRKTAPNLPDYHVKKSNYQYANIASAMNLNTITDKSMGHHEASGGREVFSNTAENAAENVETMSDDLKVSKSRTSLLKHRPNTAKIMEIPQMPLLKSPPKVVGILNTPLKSSSQILETKTPPLREMPKILEIMKTPLKLSPGSKTVEMPQTPPVQTTPKFSEAINQVLPTVSPKITKMIHVPSSKLATFDEGSVASSQMQSRPAGVTDKMPEYSKVDVFLNEGVTHQKMITCPENLAIPAKENDKIPPTTDPTLFQNSTPKNKEITQKCSEKPQDSPKIRNASHDSPKNPPDINLSRGAEEFSAKHPSDGGVANAIHENKINDITMSEQGLPAQSSLSQLFESQEFTVDHYMDMVRCNFQAKPPEKLVGEVISPNPDEEISNSVPEVTENARKMNPQPFVIKGNEPKLFDISVKREEDRPWKKQVTEGVLEPAEAVSKRDQKSTDEIPMVVSPYFPNTDNHPVQDDKRTESSDSLKFSVSQVLNLSQDSSSQDVLGKILNYEQAADDYQICKEFFSYRSPPQTHESVPKGNNSSNGRKRGKPDERKGTSKTKKPRISKKDEVDCQKITDYFTVVKKSGKNDPKAKWHQKKVVDKASQMHSDHSQDIERSSGKFQFEDLPSGSQMKMSDFYTPGTNSERLNLSKSAQKRGKMSDVAPSSSTDPNKNAQPETVAYLNHQVSTRNVLPVNEQPTEASSQATIQFNCFPRQRHRLDDGDCKVIHLEEERVEEVASTMESSGDLVEIGFTICYGQNHSRLNYRPDDGGTSHSPCGIMSRVQFADSKPLFIYQDMNGLAGENGRSFISCLLGSKCQKVCFEAHAFIKFVLDVLREQDLRICYDWHLLDPMIGMWLIDPDHPPTQHFPLLLDELGLKVIKSERDDWKVTVSRYLSVQSLAIEKLYDRLTDLGLWDVFNRMETPITPILAVMKLRTIQVDYSRLRETSKVLQKKISAVEQDAWELVGRKFHMSSPVQLRRILYEELKLDEIGSIDIKTTATSKAKSTDEGTLKSLVGLHPLPRLILEYRHAHKIKTTYIDGLLSHVVNKRTISTTWEQCAAATGRITSSKPNMQSIPKRDEEMMVAGENFNVRKVFIARPGRKFIAVDFQQIELRIFAHLSKDEQLMSVFKQPGDIFIAMTKMRLGTDDFDATEREKTKTLMYALLYGAGAHTVFDVLSVDAETANRICSNFYRLFPGLKNYRYSVLEECRAHKKLGSLSGRRRLFPLVTASCIEQKHYTERKAVNFTIQGSAADICKAAMLRTEMALREKGYDASLLLQIHDELLWEVPEDLESKVKDTIRKSIEETSDYWTKKFNLKVPMPVKITTGSSWGSMN